MVRKKLHYGPTTKKKMRSNAAKADMFHFKKAKNTLFPAFQSSCSLYTDSHLAETAFLAKAEVNPVPLMGGRTVAKSWLHANLHVLNSD